MFSNGLRMTLLCSSALFFHTRPILDYLTSSGALSPFPFHLDPESQVIAHPSRSSARASFIIDFSRLFGFSLAVSLVRLFAQESFEFGWIGELDLAEPACNAMTNQSSALPKTTKRDR